MMDTEDKGLLMSCSNNNNNNNNKIINYLQTLSLHYVLFKKFRLYLLVSVIVGVISMTYFVICGYAGHSLLLRRCRVHYTYYTGFFILLLRKKPTKHQPGKNR